MDPETNFDQIANVGVKDGKIAVITKDKITGKETIDAKGLVVAPGFIDGHQHAIEPYQYRLMLRDGRTTLLDTEIGAHGPKLNEWYERREGKAPVNFGVAVAHEFARAEVLDGFTDWKHLYTPDAEKTRSTMDMIDGKETIKEGWSKTRPNLEQGNQILSLIDEGLQQGGLGIGSTVGYMRRGSRPARYLNCKSWAGYTAALSPCISAIRPVMIPVKSTASRRCSQMRRH